MTPEERLARLEARADGTDKWLQSIDGKVDELLAAANMGKGAWILLLKLGAVVAAIATVIAWLLDHFGGKH